MTASGHAAATQLRSLMENRAPSHVAPEAQDKAS